MLKAGVTLMIASLWEAGPAFTQEKKMTDKATEHAAFRVGV
jgi:hypothetical protein